MIALQTIYGQSSDGPRSPMFSPTSIWKSARPEIPPFRRCRRLRCDRPRSLSKRLGHSSDEAPALVVGANMEEDAVWNNSRNLAA